MKPVQSIFENYLFIFVDFIVIFRLFFFMSLASIWSWRRLSIKYLLLLFSAGSFEKIKTTTIQYLSLKFSFSEKATKICAILLIWFWRLLSKWPSQKSWTLTNRWNARDISQIRFFFSYQSLTLFRNLISNDYYLVISYPSTKFCTFQTDYAYLYFSHFRLTIPNFCTFSRGF